MHERDTSPKYHIGDLLFGVSFLALGVFICFYTIREYPLVSEYSLGPGFFPLIVGIALVIMSASILVMTLLGKFDDAAGFPEKAGWKRIIRFSILIGAMALLFNILGMPLSFVLFIFFEMVFVERQPIKFSAFVALAATAVIYLFFVGLFEVKVPVGILGF